MSDIICPKTEKCPIFKKGVLISDRTGETYKSRYCLNADNFKTCKRYIVSGMTGKPVPEGIMPNSGLSIDVIIERIKNS